MNIGSHPSEHGKVAGARRIRPDPAYRHLAAARERGRHDPERRRGRVAGYDDLRRLQAGAALDRDAEAVGAHGDTERREHAFGMVAGRGGLDDGRLAFRVQAREQDRGFDLRARHRGLVLDALEGSSRDLHRRRAGLAQRDPGAHRAQRLGDALHRTARKGLVSGEPR